MNNFHISNLNNGGHTPVKRIGLSRKRRSSGMHQKVNIATSCSSESPTQNYPERKIKKQNSAVDEIFNENSESSIVGETTEDLSESKNKLEKVGKLSLKEKKTKSKVNDIKEMENLYLIWSNGCKNALLYLINLLRERQVEPVNVKNLLKELRIWEVMSKHFQNDPDLDFFSCDSENSD